MKEKTYRVGQSVRLSEYAIENYGSEYAGKSFEISGRFRDDHPGYDESGGRFIYEFDGLDFALYHWEIE